MGDVGGVVLQYVRVPPELALHDHQTRVVLRYVTGTLHEEHGPQVRWHT